MARRAAKRPDRSSRSATSTDPRGMAALDRGATSSGCAVRNYSPSTRRRPREALSLLRRLVRASAASRGRRGHEARPRALPALPLPLPEAERRSRCRFVEPARAASSRCGRFFKWLARQNLILSNPASDLELPRLRAAPAAAVLDRRGGRAGPRGGRPRRPARSSATARSSRRFYSTGMRRWSSSASAVYDLDAERGTLIVRQGKGKKDRVVPIGERALALDRALPRRGCGPRSWSSPTQASLFLTDSGEPLSPEPAHRSSCAGYVTQARARQDAAPAISSGTRWRR